MVFNSIDESKELLKKYNDIWSEIENKIEEVSGGKYDYKKDYMKITFNSDDDLPLNKPLKFQNMTIIQYLTIFHNYSLLYWDFVASR